MGFSILKRVKYAKLIKFSKNFIKKRKLEKIQDYSRMFYFQHGFFKINGHSIDLC